MFLADILLLAILGFFLLMLVTVAVHFFFLVPYVPTKKRVVAVMVKAARLKPQETVFDLGCGDGRLLLEAERFAKTRRTQIRAVGFEIAPLVFALAWLRKIIKNSTIRLKFQSFFSADLRPANVIFCYLLPNVMPRLAAKIKKECRKGTRIISNTFHIPGLKPSKIFTKDPANGLPTIYVYQL